MAEPKIQYAKTSDGVSIAYWTLGEGPPLIQMPIIGISHLKLEWETPEIRHYYERLAQGRKLVRYDSRGLGLSGRDATDYSSDALMLDVEAVAEHLGLERFDLSGGFHLGPVAITYAARNPERVSHLVLWSTWARASDYYKSARVQALGSLRDKHWETYTETVAHALTGWTTGEDAHRFAALMRESLTQEALQAFVRASSQFDATPDLARVRAPTLVLLRRQIEALDLSLATDVASEIPGAQLLLLEGSSIVPYLGDAESVLAAIDEFLSGKEPVQAASEPAGQSSAAGGMVTILFTDIEGSTTLTQRLGDERAQQVVRAHNAIVREALRKAGGTEIKHTGDGIMASFPLTSHAVEASIDIQRATAAHSEANPDDAFRVRAGLNAGEPVAEESDLFGSAVQLARRVCDAAPAGSIYVTDVVRQLVAGKGLSFADQGAHDLRGFEDPVTVYEVSWRE